MDKVTRIPPKHERFADTRTDRYVDIPHHRRSHRDAIRGVAKRNSALYKNLRKDARFAAPRLAMALQVEEGVVSYISMYVCRRPLLKHVESFNWKYGEWEEVGGLPYQVQQMTAAHPSMNSPARIACYPTRADAERGREIVMTPGKFYAAVHDEVEASRVQMFAETYLASKAPLNIFFVDNQAEGCDADELGDEWERRYRYPHGFTSCMSDFSSGDCHPARFYARPGNGLSLAFITTDGTPDGGVVARTIVHQERKVYVRCYGDARLARGLEARGIHVDDSALKGVKCNAHTDNSSLVAPYLDGEMEIKWDGIKSYCTVVESGNYYAQETSGYATDKNRTRCDECDDPTDEDEITYSEHHDRHICDSCREASYTMAYTSRTSQSLVRDEETITINDEHYLDDSDVLSAHGYSWSDDEQQYLHEDDSVYLGYLSDYVSMDNATKLDINYQGDEYARDADVRDIELEGETMTVHENYSGPEDATDDEEPAADQLAA